jgi:hypothetical protein
MSNPVSIAAWLYVLENVIGMVLAVVVLAILIISNIKRNKKR